jgi:hypothetical protein
MAIDWLRRMRLAGVPSEQAEAIASGPEDRFVTREYLDARLLVEREHLDARISGLLNDITWRLIGLAVIVLAAVTALDKFVRP